MSSPRPLLNHQHARTFPSPKPGSYKSTGTRPRAKTDAYRRHGVFGHYSTPATDTSIYSIDGTHSFGIDDRKPILTSNSPNSSTHSPLLSSLHDQEASTIGLPPMSPSPSIAGSGRSRDSPSNSQLPSLHNLNSGDNSPSSDMFTLPSLSSHAHTPLPPAYTEHAVHSNNSGLYVYANSNQNMNGSSTNSAQVSSFYPTPISDTPQYPLSSSSFSPSHILISNPTTNTITPSHSHTSNHPRTAEEYEAELARLRNQLQTVEWSRDNFRDKLAEVQGEKAVYGLTEKFGMNLNHGGGVGVDLGGTDRDKGMTPEFKRGWSMRTEARVKQLCSLNRAGNALCAWHDSRRERRQYAPRNAPTGVLNCGCTYEEALFEEALTRHNVGSYHPGESVRMDPVLRNPLLKLLQQRFGYKDGDFERYRMKIATTEDGEDIYEWRWPESDGPQDWMACQAQVGNSPATRKH